MVYCTESSYVEVMIRGGGGRDNNVSCAKSASFSVMLQFLSKLEWDLSVFTFQSFGIVYKCYSVFSSYHFCSSF